MAARNILLHNFWWKLLSLLLAALVWLMLNSAASRTTRGGSRRCSRWRRRVRDVYEDVPITVLVPPSNTEPFHGDAGPRWR